MNQYDQNNTPLDQMLNDMDEIFETANTTFHTRLQNEKNISTQVLIAIQFTSFSLLILLLLRRLWKYSILGIQNDEL